MSYESESQNVDSNYESNRLAKMTEAVQAMSPVKYALDNALRGTRDQADRTMLSTAYDLVRQAEDLVTVVRERAMNNDE
jgi:hypothetical protein